jgi:hypothetical protein
MQAEVKDNLDTVHAEIKAGTSTSGTSPPPTPTGSSGNSPNTSASDDPRSGGQGPQSGERQGNRLRQDGEGEQGPLWRDPRGHREQGPGRRHLPLMPCATRYRRRRGCQPSARSALRPVDHARPTPWRTAQARLGSRRPQQGSSPRHVWRSASRTGADHKKFQAGERRTAGEAWHDNNLVFCHENSDPYMSGALNWRFSKTLPRLFTDM